MLRNRFANFDFAQGVEAHRAENHAFCSLAPRGFQGDQSLGRARQLLEASLIRPAMTSQNRLHLIHGNTATLQESFDGDRPPKQAEDSARELRKDEPPKSR